MLARGELRIVESAVINTCRCCGKSGDPPRPATAGLEAAADSGVVAFTTAKGLRVGLCADCTRLAAAAFARAANR